MLCIGIVNVLITIPLVMQQPSTLTLCLHRIIVSIISSYSFMVFAYLFAKSINGPEDIEETSQW